MPPPFRAEQIGSLLRPPSLISARRNSKASNHSSLDESSEDIKLLTRSAIRDALAQQLKRRIRPLSNGEYPRYIFFAGFFETLEGMQEFPALPVPEGFRTDFPTMTVLQKLGVKTRAGFVATGKVRWVRSAYLKEWEEMKQALAELCGGAAGQEADYGGGRELWKECKMAMPTIAWQHMLLKVGTAWSPSSGYTSDKEYFEDLAAAYRQEIRTLYDAGLRNIQVDDPNMTYFITEPFLSGCKKDGVDPDELLDMYIWVHNLCLMGKPADLHVGIHLCRGNLAGSVHVTSGSYERIARRLFQEMQYDTFYLEYDTERAGGFEPLRFLPREKNVVLGVISTKMAELEDIDMLEDRVKEAAGVIARAQNRTVEEVLEQQIGVSPQCGFSSMSEGGGIGVTENRMWEKLELVRNLAARLWPDRGA
ncbi:5-methyltetrahydropteroyltriglutamate-homocysteine methyltransferase [Glonium stellatum]|uniref:5-methyltetrahydropteroyltriglutamate-homocysteine methyltransferase n=1 Tax=Glonium stellatum TaxID=574774 RepID=A0A8E2F5R0_9PEZI|nr:5-methyltetrahydropteroyltriglutamate-homocysteine methyltransferase [Glonium stellatum]